MLFFGSFYASNNHEKNTIVSTKILSSTNAFNCDDKNVHQMTLSYFTINHLHFTIDLKQIFQKKTVYFKLIISYNLIL